MSLFKSISATVWTINEMKRERIFKQYTFESKDFYKDLPAYIIHRRILNDSTHSLCFIFNKNMIQQLINYILLGLHCKRYFVKQISTMCIDYNDWLLDAPQQVARCNYCKYLSIEKKIELLKYETYELQNWLNMCFPSKKLGLR